MKHIILLLFISITCSIYGQGYYNNNAKFFNEDIDSILIRLQSKGFNLLDIHITTKYKGGGIDLHHLFKRINDTLIREERKYDINEKSSVYYYYCNKNKIKFLKSEDDNKILNKVLKQGFSLPAQFTKEKDSVGYKITYRYMIINKDTILMEGDKIKKDVNGNVIYHMSFLGKDLTPAFEENSLYLGDTVKYSTTWSWGNGRKNFLMSDSTHFKISYSENVKTITSINKNSLVADAKGTIISSSDSSKRRIHFDGNGIIEEESYDESDKDGNSLNGEMKVKYQ